MTVVPFGASVPAAGPARRRRPSARRTRRRRASTVKPCALRARASRSRTAAPTTSGTATGFGPSRDVDAHGRALQHAVARRRVLGGDRVRLAPASRRGRSSGSGRRPASAAIASVTRDARARRAPHLRLAGRDRRSSRSSPCATFARRPGSASIDLPVGTVSLGRGFTRRRQARPARSSAPRGPAAASRHVGHRDRPVRCRAGPGSARRGTSRRRRRRGSAAAASSHGQIERPRGGSS